MLQQSELGIKRPLRCWLTAFVSSTFITISLIEKEQKNPCIRLLILYTIIIHQLEHTYNETLK